MPVSDRDRNRLAALIAIVKPANSLAARFETLTDEQRDYYWYWHQRYGDWLRRCLVLDDDNEPDARPYARMLEHDTSPRLRRDIDEALFGKAPRIPTAMSDVEAAQIWFGEAQK
ncbi:hypothetical protein [Bradyrhizobium arachidis]|uniref:hypothetical protein n=1 Tax=Bradyrhizobium arachidis TaxID=858423 RepID=UPI00116037D2|nr:hypothetical protein [Bradyrhizobium arachidis]